MTHFDMMNTVDPEKISEQVYSHEAARNCLLPMGITSENVAKQFGVSREEQDSFAAASHAKCVAAQRAGLFDEEIVPVKTKIKEKDGRERELIVEKDEGARAGTTTEILSKLPPAFQTGGSTTAEKAKLRIEDIDLFELNEAFASQATYCARELKIPIEKLNPKVACRLHLDTLFQEYKFSRYFRRRHCTRTSTWLYRRSTNSDTFARATSKEIEIRRRLHVCRHGNGGCSGHRKS
ncbi:UNVERIFIED_CONTAM: hypothetical protein H355_004201 [Colinus virginianus]|nr:hypothetical protein H355_004201 [Colinus virginianus]